MHIAGLEASRTGLLAGQAEVANENRLARIAQVINLHHALRAPAGLAGNQKRDAAVALPPALMRIDQAFEDDGHAIRVRRIGDVPNFMGVGALGAQQVHFAFVGMRQLRAIAKTRHLRAAGFARAGNARIAGNMGEVLGLLRIGDVNDRRAVVLCFPRKRIHRGAAMMSNVGDPAVALLMNRGLIRAAALQVTVADQIHIFYFWLLLSGGGKSESGNRESKNQNDDPRFTRANLARHKFSFSESAANVAVAGLDCRIANLTMSLFKPLSRLTRG